MQEAKYSRQTFELIVETYDKDRLRHYEIRDDGAWLIEQQIGADEITAWTPACALENIPGSPDPLATPAIPFPFAARQLTAWMLSGWGCLVSSALGDWGADLDPEVLGMLGMRGGKAREAIAAAYREYRSAVAKVGAEPKEQWLTAQTTRERYGEAWDLARAKHGLLTPDGRIASSLSDEDYSAKLKLAHADVIEELRTMTEAQAILKRYQEQWLADMVSLLLLTAEDDRADELRAEANFIEGFESARDGHGLDAHRWAALPLVQAKHAAMLIAGINPTHHPDPDQQAPAHADLPKYRMAFGTFESHERHDGIYRSLRDWVVVAQTHALQIDARVLAAVESTPVTSSSKAGVASTRGAAIELCEATIGAFREAPPTEGHHGGASKTQETANQKEQEIDFKVLAMPEKLLSVFGGFGLKASHFDKLQGPLQRAQKVPGKPGRGGYPGWFCPYEVMIWLAKSTRYRMSEEAGWRLLKGHFEDTYAKFGIGDPNT